MKIIDLKKKNIDNLLLVLILITTIIIIFGIVVIPQVFYDQWIWKYYWGPVVADASGGTAIFNGVKANEGYTIVSEITYGIIIILALYFIYRLLKKLNIIVDWRFAVALMPYIFFGPVTRVLEDTGYFDEPFVYWFISPLIYLQIAIYALFFVILGYYLDKNCKKYNITVNKTVFIGGLILLIPPLILIAQWLIGNQWAYTTGVRFDVFFLVNFFILLITGLVYFVSNFFKQKTQFLVYKNPLNLIMLVGHMLDGITSYISIKDPLNMGLGYAEKHPASDTLLNIWGPLFPIVKFLLIIFIIYVFDILYIGY